MIKALTLSAMTALTASALVAAPTANATPGCNSVPWGFLGTQTRQICDGPIQPDGSWTRRRIVGVPAHYVNATSSCSTGSYYSNCTYYPAGWVAERIASDETYPVNAETVLPDEPGHVS